MDQKIIRVSVARAKRQVQIKIGPSVDVVGRDVCTQFQPDPTLLWHDKACGTVASAFLTSNEHCDWLRNAFFGLLRRLEDSFEVLETLKKAAKKAYTAVSDLKELVPQLRQHAMMRQRLHLEAVAVCKLVQKPAGLPLQELLREVADVGVEKSTFGHGIVIHNTIGGTYELKFAGVDSIEFVASSEDDGTKTDTPERFDAGLETFVGDSFAKGLPLAWVMRGHFVCDKFQEVVNHWLHCKPERTPCIRSCSKSQIPVLSFTWSRDLGVLLLMDSRCFVFIGGIRSHTCGTNSKH